MKITTLVFFYLSAILLLTTQLRAESVQDNIGNSGTLSQIHRSDLEGLRPGDRIEVNPDGPGAIWDADDGSPTTFLEPGTAIIISDRKDLRDGHSGPGSCIKFFIKMPGIRTGAKG